MNALTDLIAAFLRMFSLLTVFALPLFWVYSGGSYHAENPLVTYSLGSLGGASVYCAQFPLAKARAEIACPSGTHFDARYAQFGVLNSAFEDYSQCTQRAADAALDW